jgi:cell division protein FtsB
MIRHRRPTTREYLIALALFLLLLWLLFLFWGIFRKEEVARQAAEETKKELATLSEREDTLKANIADLNTERGQEASIRETYGVAKPGEEVIIVVPPEEGETVPKDPWWKVFLSWFGIH